MTFRQFDNKCAELADAACDIGEKTLWLIIIMSLAFAAMVYSNRAEAQTDAELYRDLVMLQRALQAAPSTTGGAYGFGESVIAKEKTKVDPWSGRTYNERVIQAVPNDVWGRPVRPLLPDEPDTSWIYEALRK
jgi:hypothetical protein